jgi:hypothetical protein
MIGFGPFMGLDKVFLKSLPSLFTYALPYHNIIPSVFGPFMGYNELFFVPTKYFLFQAQ